jgi:Tfp pilus assembly protein FimT
MAGGVQLTQAVAGNGRKDNMMRNSSILSVSDYRTATQRLAGGFTAVELLITVACIAIAALIVVPAIGDTAPWQLKNAAEVVVADLEYAQTQSIAHPDDPRVFVLDTANSSYYIAAASNPSTPLTNPVGGLPYKVKFGAGRAASVPSVRFGAISVGGDNRLGFGGYGQLDQSTAATITLSAGTHSLTITLDAVTGEASVGTVD